MNIQNIAYFFISVISIVTTLIYGQSLLIPFVFALLVWFTVREIKSYMDKITFVREKFPSWVKTLLTSSLLFVVMGFASKIITSNIKSLAKSYKTYEANIGALLNQVNESLDINIQDLVQGHSGDFDFGTVLGTVFSSITDILSSTFMIVLYVLFIFLEESNFHLKLKNIFTDPAKYDRMSSILDQIESAIAQYLRLKTLVSMITGVGSYVILLCIGVESPIFWAFLIFLLNFIPTIGSLIGTLFPAMFCLLQFGEFGPAILVLALVGMVQVLVGNILEPKMMGNSMNLSALVTIIALSFWGAVWGVTGMILSIPITVIMVIVFSQFPKTRSVAIMLSEKGNID